MIIYFFKFLQKQLLVIKFTRIYNIIHVCDLYQKKLSEFSKKFGLNLPMSVNVPFIDIYYNITEKPHKNVDMKLICSFRVEEILRLIFATTTN